MLIFKRVIFALISVLTLYIGNLPPKRGGRATPPTPPTYAPAYIMIENKKDLRVDNSRRAVHVL